MPTDNYTDVLDGAMITLAMYTLNIFHPGILLRSPNIIRSEFDDSEIAMKHPKGQTIVTHSPVVA